MISSSPIGNIVNNIMFIGNLHQLQPVTLSTRVGHFCWLQ